MICMQRRKQLNSEMQGCLPALLLSVIIWAVIIEVLRMDWLTQHWSDVTEVIAYVIAIAHIITEVTPTPRDDKALGKLYKLLETIGFQVLKSKQSNRVKL